jgi:hypothetical protein
MPDQPPEESRQFYPSLLSQGQQPAEDPLAPPAQPPPEPPSADDELVHGARKEKLGRKPSVIPDTLPPGQATLVISGTGEAHAKQHFSFDLSCCCMASDSYEDANFGRSQIDLATNIAPGGPPAAQFLLEMRTWSGKKKDLRDWLDACRERHPDDLQLLIWDKSGAGTPWELVRLPAKSAGDTAGYLGALAAITRWPGDRLPDADHVRRLADPIPSRGAGPVLGHVTSSMADDRTMVGQFFQLADPFPEDIWALFERLESESLPLALVYIACHGEFGSAPEDCKLDSLSVARASIFEGQLPGLTAQSTLAFLNACYSGSEGIDTDKYDDGALRGFADYFLDRGATGVLAATGAVGTNDAHKLARQLFTMLEGNPGLTVPRALRRLRADRMTELETAERELTKKQTRRDDRRMHVPQADLAAFDQAALVEDTNDTAALLPLLYPYMYVYFGLPRLWPAAVQPASRPAAQPTVQPGGQGSTGELTGTSG